MTTLASALPTVINVRDLAQPWPADVVYIGRANRRHGLAQSPWANPFVIAYGQERAQALARYEAYLRQDRPDLLDRLPDLLGKRLACWCAPQPCHGHVIVRLLQERVLAAYG